MVYFAPSWAYSKGQAVDEMLLRIKRTETDLEKRGFYTAACVVSKRSHPGSVIITLLDKKEIVELSGWEKWVLAGDPSAFGGEVYDYHVKVYTD